jgi:hypothetical protein
MLQGLLLVLGLGVGAAWGASAGPLLEIIPEGINLGLMAPGSQKQFELSVSNRGKEGLVIHSVSTDCGCLSPASGAKDLKVGPGEEVRLPFTIMTNGQMRGLNSKRILLRTNDPAKPAAVVGVSFTVKPDYRVAVMPTRIKLGRVESGLGLTREVVLVSPYPRALKVESAKGSAEWITVSEGKRNGRGDVVSLAVSLRVPADIGAIQEMITIVTDVGRVEIPVEGRAIGLLEVEPAALVLPPVKGSEPMAVSLEVRAVGKRAFKVVGVTAARGKVADVVDTVKESGAAHALEFRFSPPAESGSGSDRVNIATDTMGVFTVEVFYLATGK